MIDELNGEIEQLKVGILNEITEIQSQENKKLEYLRDKYIRREKEF
jgi:hypothetical protein